MASLKTVDSADLENNMSVTQELRKHIEAAEQKFHEKKYPEALAENDRAIVAAKRPEVTKDNFPLALITRLVKITRDLGEWSRDLVDSSDDNKHFTETQTILD